MNNVEKENLIIEVKKILSEITIINGQLSVYNGEVDATKSINVNDFNRLIGTVKTNEGVN